MEHINSFDAVYQKSLKDKFYFTDFDPNGAVGYRFGDLQQTGAKTTGTVAKSRS